MTFVDLCAKVLAMTQWLCPIFGFLFGFSVVNMGVSLWWHQVTSSCIFATLAAVSFAVVLFAVAAQAR